MSLEARAIAARKREVAALTRNIIRVPYTPAGRLREARALKRRLKAGGLIP